VGSARQYVDAVFVFGRELVCSYPTVHGRDLIYDYRMQLLVARFGRCPLLVRKTSFGRHHPVL
jgi:hypothetical protein